MNKSATSQILRRRLTDAKELIGFLHQNTILVLRSDSLLKYKDKFKCILIPSHLEEMERQAALMNDEPFDVRRTHFFLEHSLRVPVITVTNLSVQPGERQFVVWLIVSAYFPLMSACLAPLANLVSFIGLLQNWRYDPVLQKDHHEARSVLPLNIIAFVMGILGNASLVLNFLGLFRYSFTQCVSITCWILAASILMAAVIVTALDPAPNIVLTEGYWLAVFTVGMYYLCLLVMLLNYLGYWLQKYPATLNLTRKQRLLMSFTILFCVWQAISTIAVSKLILGLSYGSSLYYCTVSMLTIGLGDVVPETAGAKVYALTFSFVGVLIMGLIVSVLRQVVLTSAGPSIFWHHVEIKRLKALGKMRAAATLRKPTGGSIHLDHDTSPDMRSNPDQDLSFARIRHIRRKVHASQSQRQLLWTVVIFILFSLLGALIFSRIEKWNYFNAVYFCFLCLLTIGYGDFHPQKPLGKVFFVMWAIAAVPLMTILVLNVGDHIYDTAVKVDDFTSRAFNFKTYARLFSRKLPAKDVTTQPQLPEKLPSPEPHTQEQAQLHKTREIVKSFGAFKTLFVDMLEHPEKRYDASEWKDFLEYFQVHDLSEEHFWMGEFLPLKLPLKESNYLLMTAMFKMSHDLRELQQMQEKAMNSDTASTLLSFSTDLGPLKLPGNDAPVSDPTQVSSDASN